MTTLGKTDLQILREIRQECEKDANSLDGMPLNGKTVGAMFGNLLAAVTTLVSIIERHLKHGD